MKKPKKPRSIKSRKLSHDSLSVQIIKDPTEIVEICAWDSKVTLTASEVIKLTEWLKKAVPYVKSVYNLK